MPKSFLTAALVLVGLFLLSTTGSPAEGQRVGQEFVDPDESFLASRFVSVGYVVDAPDQLVGFGVSTVGSMWSGWGLYADVKFSVATPESEDNFTEARTASEADQLGDQRFSELESAWNTVNLALIRAVTHEVALYAGAGYSQETVYREYFDDQIERGIQGFYTVEDERQGGDTVNMLGGLLFRATRHLMFQFGGETAPAGFTAGVNLVFPFAR